MPRAWFWYGTRQRPGLSPPPFEKGGIEGVFVALSLALAATAHGATVLDQRLEVEISAAGVREHTRLEVRLDGAGDLESWSSYPIYLDEHRSLAAVAAHARGPGGETVKVRRKDQDEVQAATGVSFVDSARYHILHFDSLAPGSVLVIDFEVEARPYFPAGQLALAGDDPIERLAVEVRGGGAGWRWRIDGPAAGLEVEESAGGVRITGRDLPAVDPPELAPGGAATTPVLRYAWGTAGDWRDVGGWLGGLLETLPRGGDQVAAQARELLAGAADPRARLEALYAFLQHQVRYVAVEVGIGGFRPSAPQEVLARRWGDCKDKSLLLVDLLAEAGIEAYPALIRAGSDRRIDAEFPSPWQFNHMIVALPAEAAPLAEDDPTAGGYLFLDPTQTRGSIRWLHPGVQDQEALVVRDGGGELARTPIRHHLERRGLAVQLEAAGPNALKGRAGLRLVGRRAVPWLNQIATEPPERTAEDARSAFASLLPGARVAGLGWQEVEGGVPAVDLVADVEVEGLILGRGPRRSLRLPGMQVAPPLRLFDDRETPVVLSPGSTEMSWQVALPEGCRVEPGEQRHESPAGFFEQSVAGGPGTLTVRRRSELRRRWFEPEAFDELRELAEAEHRAFRRRIWLDCGPPAARVPAGS